MGTNTYQIATRANLNAKRLGTYSSDLTRCVTLDNVDSWEGLTSGNTAVSVAGAGNGVALSSSGRLFVASTSASSNLNTPYSTYRNGSLYHCVSSGTVYCSGTTNTVYFHMVESNNNYNWDQLYNYSLIRVPLSPVAGKQVTLACNISPSVGFYTNRPTSSSYIQGDGGFIVQYWYYVAAIIDSNGNILAGGNRTYGSSADTSAINLSFTAPGGTVYFCILPTDISLTSNNHPAGSLYYSMGLYMSTINVTAKDFGYKLCKYSSIAQRSFSFYLYYGIWNNKSSNAKLDTLYVYANTTGSTGGTQIGSVSLGTVSSTKTGYVTCTLPTSLALSGQLYLALKAGDTALNQDWYCANGNSSSMSSASWSYVGKAKGCNYVGIRLNGAQGVLKTTTSPSGYYGRSSSNAFMFRIT